MMYIENLSLEITRKCSCACSHCLRGDSQNIDMPLDLIPKIFNGIKWIDNITFTGGEPSLNLYFMKEMLKYCKRHSIDVKSIYVVTNGLQNQKELGTMTDIYNYLLNFCKEKGIKKIVVQSVETKEMADFCLKHNLQPNEYCMDAGDYLMGDYEFNI
ncbi:radical SAM protein [Hungatella hathewayi]|uniref:radical SAM protein n=1 Tax=Hungatella hathewayi TaxID=154046 RepID=UPI00356B1F5C